MPSILVNRSSKFALEAFDHRPRDWFTVVLLVALVGSALDLLSKWLVISGGHGHILNDARLLGFDLAGTRLTDLLVSGSVAAGYVTLGYRSRRRYRRVGVGLVAGGGLANAIDRLLDGSVVDFLPFPGGLYVNLADIMVVIGLVVAVDARKRPASLHGPSAPDCQMKHPSAAASHPGPGSQSNAVPASHLDLMGLGAVDRVRTGRRSWNRVRTRASWF